VNQLKERGLQMGIAIFGIVFIGLMFMGVGAAWAFGLFE